MLAEKCGVEHPEIRAAIEQDHTFYAGFIGRGTLPYGVHNPNAKSFNNNGMSGLAAVAFSLYGDKEGAAFFSRMCRPPPIPRWKPATPATISTRCGPASARISPGRKPPPPSSAKPAGSTRSTAPGTGTSPMTAAIPSKATFPTAASAMPARICSTTASAATSSSSPAATPIRRSGSRAARWRETVALATLDLKNNERRGTARAVRPPAAQGADRGGLDAAFARTHKLAAAIRKMLAEGTREQRLSAIEYFGYQCPHELALPVRDDLAAILRESRRRHGACAPRRPARSAASGRMPIRISTTCWDWSSRTSRTIRSGASTRNWDAA